MHKKESFITNRLKSIRIALRGAFLLLKTEASIQIQSVIAVIIIVLGFVYKISTTEWIAQLTVIAMVLGVESLNTAVEKIADFIHPDYHKKIGFIKDISAGAVVIVAIIAAIIGGIIYVPKMF